MMPNVLQASSTVLEQLANPAARALALGVAAGLGLTAFRVRSTSARLFTWTTVLYAAVAMPLLGWILPPVPISTPAFLQGALFQHLVQQPVSSSGQVFPSATSTSRMEPAWSTATKKRLPMSQTISASSPTPMRKRSQSVLSSIPLRIVAAGIYLAIASLLLVRFFIGLAFGRRLIRASRAIEEERVFIRVAERARASDLSVPEMLESEFISVPVTMGVLRPTILLPTTWCDWDDAKLDAVIAHEMSHVSRRDALTQRLSLLHRAIFWFSPLAWWLDRRLADLAEQASDEAALACGTDRKHYARILLGFFEALHTSPGRVWWQGVSMAKAGQAEERLERILASKGSVAMHLKKSIAIAVIAFAIPTVYVVASAHSAPRVGATTAIPQSQTPPTSAAPTSNLAPKVAPAQIRGTIQGGVAAIPEPSLAPEGGVESVVSPADAMAPVEPVVAVLGAQEHDSHSSHSSGNGYSYGYGYDDDQRFVIVTGNSDSLTMSGSRADARHVEKLKKSIPGDFIWFQSDEKSYVIRDQATIDRARKLWTPQEELGKKQEALGKQQEALGTQQEALGKKMEEIHVKVPDMTADLDKLKAELKQLTSSATMDQVGKIQSEIGELQSKIGDLQSHAGEQQGKLGEEMGALGERQGELGEEQGKLGEQQARLAEEATRQMKILLEEAIKKGTAQPEI